MSRLDDAIGRITKKPTEPEFGYITRQDMVDAFTDLYQAANDLMLIKQDQLPVNGGDGDVLMLQNFQWVPSPLPPTTGGGVSGVLTGAGSPLPQAPLAGALYLVGTDVPTAVTAVIPNAKTGDLITWDGTAWIHTGAGGGLPVPIPAGPLDQGKHLVVNAAGTGAVWQHPSGVLVGNGMPPTTPIPDIGDWFFDAAGQNLYSFVHTAAGNVWQLVSGLEDFAEMFNGGNVPAPYDTTRAYPTRAVVESGGLFYLATEPVNAGEGAGTSPKWVQLSLDGLMARSVPKGGTVGQVLVKQSGTDFDAQWDDLTALLPGVTHFRGTVADAAALAALQSVNPGDVAITLDNGHMHVYANAMWDDIGPAAGNTLPAPGNAGDILTVVNGAATWVHPAAATSGIPVGGAAGQVLAKVDGTDGNVHWVDVLGGLLAPELFSGHVVPDWTATAYPAGAVVAHVNLATTPKGAFFWTENGAQATDEPGAPGLNNPWTVIDLRDIYRLAGGLPAHTPADAEKALHVLPDGSVAWKYAVPIVVKATQPTAADYGEATIPNNAVWLKKV